ncbi:putative 5'(3')-deoxyribonucleotidase [Vibrio phage vB_VpaM_R16F]|nr:putative 5'(3')-deoxyribonucleotidase [Vibrio phage vB_VpaM_R16F]
MQKKNKIVIDVDLTITYPDIGQMWWEHLVEYYSDCQTMEQYCQFCDDYENGVAEYDLTKYFTLPDGCCRLGWFKQDDLYDNMSIAPNSYSVIRNMYEAGFDIYFVSYCQSEHQQSKEDYLRRHFDFLQGDDFHFVSTKSKGCMDGSAFAVIEDRLDFVAQFKEDALKILIDTPYKQECTAEVDYVKCKDWLEIEEIFVKYLEEVL